MSAFVKIGDTPVDMEEGRNAGMWTIGITRTGNEVGQTESEWQQASGPEREAWIGRAAERLTAAGADYLAETAAACDEILNEIDRRLRIGERP